MGWYVGPAKFKVYAAAHARHWDPLGDDDALGEDEGSKLRLRVRGKIR